MDGERLVVSSHPQRPDVQVYGTLSWPKRLRDQYFESRGYTVEGRPKTPLSAGKEPRKVAVASGPSHYELFVLSLRENRPSPESAREGHYAAGAGHLANVAYRQGKRAVWDPETATVS